MRDLIESTVRGETIVRIEHVPVTDLRTPVRVRVSADNRCFQVRESVTRPLHPILWLSAFIWVSMVGNGVFWLLTR